MIRVFGFLLALLAGAASANPVELASLGDLSIEQLLDEPVTSVSRREQKLSGSPAAIAVITAEDLRRLGITSLPEALRLVPGMDVARISASEWAISARGFNSQYASKLLVLLDGRTLYTPASAGVFWNAQDLPLGLVDRIEVIRGPGATLWGANAVNGVINIITRSAADTPGATAALDLGNPEWPGASLAYGGRFERFAGAPQWRVYARYFNRRPLLGGEGAGTDESWHGLRGGFRADWTRAGEAWTLQGDWYDGLAGKTVDRPSLDPAGSQTVQRPVRFAGGDLLGRWTHRFAAGGELAVQSYFDHVEQGDGAGMEYRNTLDLDVQHHFEWGRRQNLVWGLGYRHTDIDNSPSFELTWTPRRHGLDLVNLFLQDELELAPTLHLTLGSKLEHNSLAGLEVEPGARLAWTPAERHALWASVARATRTPSLFERYSRLNMAAFQPSAQAPPVLITEFGNPNLNAETLTASELGYRVQPLPELSLDLAAFYNVYRRRIVAVADPPGFEVQPAPPHVLLPSTFQNAGSGRSYGAELLAQWQATPRWKLAASYSWLRLDLRPDSETEGDSPRHQWQLRSYLDLPAGLELNGAASWVAAIHPQAAGERVKVPAYVRCDLGLVWRPRPGLTLGLWGQNLLDARHPEFTSLDSSARVEVPRGWLARFDWRFQ